MEHTFDYCGMCGWMVRCGKCGNNCCNGMYGRLGPDDLPWDEQEECDECRNAYDMKDNVKDSPELMAKLHDFLVAYYLERSDGKPIPELNDDPWEAIQDLNELCMGVSPDPFAGWVPATDEQLDDVLGDD